MTIDNLQDYVEGYVAKAKQAGQWNKTSDNFIGLVDKIGKIVSLDGGFQDKLPELSGDTLPYGKTIEEYFIDLTLPTTYSNMTTEGAKDVVPAVPTVEDVAYSYTLGKSKIKTTEPYDNVERAAETAGDSAAMVGKIYQRLRDSYTMFVYGAKKQLIGNTCTKIEAANNAALISQVAIPVDTETGEAFIEEVKKCVEDASFASEGNNLGNCLIGAAPSMTLYVKKGVMPSLQVKTLAGAFNKEDMGFDCKVKVIDDFGAYDGGAYAVLVDDRAIRLHEGYQATRTSENADGDFVNVVLHSEHTGFISKYAYVHEFKAN